MELTPCLSTLTSGADECPQHPYHSEMLRMPATVKGVASLRLPAAGTRTHCQVGNIIIIILLSLCESVCRNIIGLVDKAHIPLEMGFALATQRE